MGLGLKIFWGTILSALIIGMVTLATIGIPSPAVEIRKPIDIETALK